MLHTIHKQYVKFTYYIFYIVYSGRDAVEVTTILLVYCRAVKCCRCEEVEVIATSDHI